MTNYNVHTQNAAEQSAVTLTGNAAASSQSYNSTPSACGKSVPSRPSFGEIWESVRVQVEFDCFEPADRAEADALCRIIAEVLLLGGDGFVKIAGDELPLSAAREIFSALSHEHIELVIENLRKNASPIKSKKAYLRACLYNSFFELEEHYRNFGRVVASGRSGKWG